jgi:UDP-GlcNAc:undecaprenyl-phosphate/decaprenyl-phosphate GlcNAc-1-phosphate transferase
MDWLWTARTGGRFPPPVDVVALATAAAITFAACWPLRQLALHFEILDRPGRHKAHAKPVPYLGGVAIWMGALGALAVFDLHQTWIPALFAVLVALGIADDLLTIGVASRLFVQVSLAVAAVGLGAVWHITDSTALNAIVSVVWIVGLTNSLNLLDNMDGLASTVGATGLLVVAFIDPGQTTFQLALAGALIGFLFVNMPPARMYMGDAGSLMVGFGLAVATISAANHARGLHSLVLIVGPVAVAVFDTMLVITSRIMSGRPIQLGGRDHFSHRLQLQGWSPELVLAASAGAAAAAGFAAYLASTYPVTTAWLALPLAAACASAWWWLLKIDPYANERPAVVDAFSA